jgi:mannonate dehydratase
MTFPHLPDGIQLSVRVRPDASEEDLSFVEQIGIDHVFVWFKGETLDLETIKAFRARTAAHGLNLFNAGFLPLCKNPKIHLALPGRDEAIEAFCDYLRMLAEAEIYTTTFTWEVAGDTTSSPKEPARGGALCRAVDMATLDKAPLSHGRRYSEEELWANFTYFMNAVIPVAEEVGVRLALHPNDPPVPELGGVPCLIHNLAGYRKAFEICDSEYFGMEFCTGCWLEGADNFGDMFAAIEEFVRRGKVFIAHFRNVSAPLPHFVESFIDDGYMDMHRVMQAFQDAGYRGTLVPDHADEMGGSMTGQAGMAFVVGYMRALLERASGIRGNPHGRPAP